MATRFKDQMWKLYSFASGAGIPKRKAISAAITPSIIAFSALAISSNSIHAEEMNTDTASDTTKSANKREPRGPGAKVLPPDRFFGKAKAGYAAAQKIPHICAKLFCYCGCDLTDCHGSLLDCFTSEHGEDCHICQEEAIKALVLDKKGKSLKQIQKYIDKKYAKEYPFEVESEALKKYRSTRLWGKKKKQVVKKHKPGADARVELQVRRLREDGTCCVGEKRDSR